MWNRPHDRQVVVCGNVPEESIGRVRTSLVRTNNIIMVVRGVFPRTLPVVIARHEAISLWGWRTGHREWLATRAK